MSKPSEHAQIDLIIPVYNECDVLVSFHATLSQVIDQLPHHFTIYYVNDGSTDQTQAGLQQLAQSDPRIVVIELSRNFGHQAALSAGLDLAAGEIVITMDGDGQHPPALIPQMLSLYQSGYDIVLTQRLETADLPLFKRWSSSSFYWFINRLSDTKIFPGSADYRLMARNAVQGLRQMKEYHRFLRGMVSWMGFQTIILPYEPVERIAGKSKYSLKKMVKLALDAIFSFSLTPIWIGLLSGGCFFTLALLEVVYVLSFWLSGRQDMLAPGWSSLIFVILIVGGTIMINLGFVGVYVGYIFQEVKHRPIYLIRSVTEKSKIDETQADG
ncbi:MAG: glycosyltransferase family 2 protein [Chloroflexota bacterium]